MKKSNPREKSADQKLLTLIENLPAMRKTSFVSGHELAWKMNWRNIPTVRAIRRRVFDLRRKGHPILSQSGIGGGYRYGRKPAEILACHKRLLREALSRIETAYALKKGKVLYRIKLQLGFLFSKGE